MTNIVLLSPTFLPTIGGRELVIYYLAQYLHGLNHKVRVVGPSKWWSNRKNKLQYAVHRYPSAVRKMFGLFGPESQLREKELLYQLLFDIHIWGCDVIHAHTTYPSGYIASKVKKKLGNCKLVITPHGIDIHAIPEIGHGKRLDPLIKPKIEEALESADSITAISEGIESSLLQAGADSNKIFRIPNGVDFERFNRITQINIRNEFQLSDKDKLIVTVGNYHPRKGQEIIIKAMPIVLESEPRARLVIVGNGTKKLIKLIRDLSIEGKVILTGSVDFPLPEFNKEKRISTDPERDRLAAIHQNSEIYISAGVEEGAEGLSLAVLEAMASSLPIVGTNISGNRDIIKDGYNGIMVKPGDVNQMANAMLHLLRNEELRKKMGKNAKNSIEKYSWSEITNQYINLYKSLK